MSAPFRLRVESGPRAGQTFAIGGSGTTIGRQEGNDIVIDDARLSRQHARLELRDGILVVADLGSANGTRVNGRAVTGSQPLRPGDLLQLGQSTLRVEPGGGAPAGSPDRAGGMATLVEDLSTGPTQAVAATRTPRLILQNGLNAGREYPLDKAASLLGRDEHADIALFRDMKVEKRHAFIKRVGERYLLVNNNAPPEQTRVNDAPVGQTQELTDGDRIQLGNVILRFQARAAINRARGKRPGPTPVALPSSAIRKM